MKDGCIDVNSEAGRELGFTSDKFHPTSYLWKNGEVFVISLVQSLRPGEGNFRALLDRLEVKALAIIVPAPSKQMRRVLEPRGYVSRMIDFGTGADECLVWGVLP